MKPASTEYVNQHFVPRFLLAQWESGKDNKLSVFRWENDQLVHSRRKAKSVGKLAHLYSTRRDSEVPDVSLERDFLGPQIDDPAAEVHIALLKSPAETLDTDARNAWSRFLAAQLARVPHQMTQIRRDGRRIVISRLEAAAGRVDEETSNLPILEDFGPKALPWILESPRMIGTFETATWGLRKFAEDATSLIIGDNPLSLDGSMAGKFVYCLPLSPRCMFYAFNDLALYTQMSAASDQTIIMVHNRDQLDLAKRAVFATDTFHSELIEKHLSRPEQASPSSKA
jgi:hypothetical protein